MKKEYDLKMKKASSEYLRKNVTLLKKENPRKAYRVLKRMGAPPGENQEEGMFKLANHQAENLSDQESVDRIANHFSKISEEYPPLDVELLPQEIKKKLKDPKDVPFMSRWKTMNLLLKTKLPQSTVPFDIPAKLTKEFANEISVPLSKIFQKIINTEKFASELED